MKQSISKHSQSISGYRAGVRDIKKRRKKISFEQKKMECILGCLVRIEKL